MPRRQGGSSWALVGPGRQAEEQQLPPGPSFQELFSHCAAKVESLKGLLVSWCLPSHCQLQTTGAPHQWVSYTQLPGKHTRGTQAWGHGERTAGPLWHGAGKTAGGRAQLLGSTRGPKAVGDLKDHLQLWNFRARPLRNQSFQWLHVKYQNLWGSEKWIDLLKDEQLIKVIRTESQIWSLVLLSSSSGYHDLVFPASERTRWSN